MILGIDIDDTITYTRKTILKYRKMVYPNLNDNDLLPNKEYKKFLRKYMKDMRREYEIREGVKEAWQYFKDNNFKIIIITARSNKYYHRSIKDTIDFLDKNGIFYDKIYFNKVKKGKKAFKEHVDLFIDDNELVLDNVSKYGIKVLCRGKSDKYPSCEDWYQIINYIKEGNYE